MQSGTTRILFPHSTQRHTVKRVEKQIIYCYVFFDTFRISFDLHRRNTMKFLKHRKKRRQNLPFLPSSRPDYPGSEQPYLRILVWMLVAAISLACSFTALPATAEESGASSSAAAEQLTPRERAENSPSFSMKADPISELQTSVSRIGEILVSKNVSASQAANPADSYFDVTLSALSSWTNVTGLLSNPLDIVMVLDTSGSMRAQFNSDMKRIDALKQSVNQFLSSLERSNNKTASEEQKSRVGIITYNNDAQVQISLTSNIPSLRNCVNSLKETGVTYSNLGLQEGLKMIQSSENDGRSKVVIFFTDGMPSDGYGFTRSIADEAVAAADAIRKDGSKVYTVGIFPGADPHADVALKAGEENTNRFMQAVSSNFPNASSYSGDIGERAFSQYYLSAENPDDLEWDFEYIFNTMDGGTGYPTETNPAHPESSGYITLHDETGEWMEFCSDPVLEVNGQSYLPVSSSSTGSMIRYTYQGQVPTNVPGARTDLSCVEVTITKGTGKTGDILEVKLPSILLPLDVYSELYRSQMESRDSDQVIRHALPFSVTISTGLKEGMKQALSGTRTEQSILAASALQPGTVSSFYSNAWKSESHAYAQFNPAANNEFYHGDSADPISLQTVAKTSNVTQTDPQQTRLEKISEGDNSAYRLFLGNNGVLDTELENSVTIYKTVLSAGDYAFPKRSFSFHASLKDASGSPYSESVTAVDETGESRILTFTDGKADFVLSNTQSLTLKNLPLFASLQVEEEAAEGFATTVHTSSTSVLFSSLVSEELEIRPMSRLQVEFINEYSLQPLTLSPEESGLKAEKILSGRNWADDDVFILGCTALSPENTPLPEKSEVQISGSSSSKTADFGSVQFDHPGIYTYLIYEKEPSENPAPGLSYSGSLYTVTIPVTDAGNGRLQAGSSVITQLRDDRGEAIQQTVSQAVFENSYSAEKTQYAPVVYKRITSVPSSGTREDALLATPGDYQFAFTLKALDEEAPMPDGAENLSITALNEGELVQFAPITFDQSCIGKTFHYEITENPVTSIAGISGSSEKILLEIAVSRALVDGKETVTVSPRYLNENGKELSSEQVLLTNRYSYTPAAAEIRGSKTLLGRDMKDQEFSFSLSAASEFTSSAIENGDIILPSTKVFAPAAEDGKAGAFSFGELVFEKPGEYYFLVTETEDTAPGIIADSRLHYVHVSVSHDPQSASLNAVVDYHNGEDAGQSSALFENRYLPVFDEKSAVSLSAEKKIDDPYKDQDLDQAEFRFRLTAPDGSERILTSPEGVFSILDNQTFNKAGVYTYQLFEEPEVAGYPQEAIRFDNSVYTIEIEVTDDGKGVLTAQTPIIRKGGERTDAILFTNALTPIAGSASALPGAEKKLSGRPLRENEFEFVWTLSTDVEDGVEVDGSPWKDPQTVSCTENGTVSFFGNSLLFTKPGHYEISLREKSGQEAGMSYDDTVLTWSYTVSVVQGRLNLVVTWPENLTFENTWTSPLANTVSVPLQARKILENGTLQGDDFAFDLMQDGKVLQTKTNDENGLIQFDSLFFHEEGDYEYVLKERKGDLKTVEYDSSELTVHIQVYKDETGTLKAKVTSDKALVFRNRETRKKPATAASLQTGFWNVSVAGALLILSFGLRKIRKHRDQEKRE